MNIMCCGPISLRSMIVVGQTIYAFATKNSKKMLTVILIITLYNTLSPVPYFHLLINKFYPGFVDAIIVAKVPTVHSLH